MGYSRKEEIAKLRQERKKAKAAKKRKENVREKHVRFLIVCEGTKTEPHYFEALIKNYISAVREVTIEGEGRATVALMDKALEIKTELEYKNAMSFDRVWVVFDKDDFDDFNEAIKKGQKLGFQSAWTNEAFELWYYLHFEYLDTGITRSDYIEKLLETEWETKLLNIEKVIPTYIACSSSMAAKSWRSGLPNDFEDYILAPTMHHINPAQWWISW